MRIGRTRALALATAVAAVALGGSAAAPAFAADLVLDAPTAVSLVPAPASGDPVAKHVTLNLTGTVKTGSHDITYTFDASGLAGLAEFAPELGNAACTVQGAVTTCKGTFYSQDGRLNQQINPQLTALKGAELGKTGHLKVTETTDAGTVSADVSVSVGGPDLRVKTKEQLTGVKPGSTITPSVQVVNQGSLPSGRLVLVLSGIAGVKPERQFANCDYATGAGSQAPSYEVAICTVNTSVAPGETVTIDPMKFGVDSSALHSYIDVAVLPGEGEDTAWYRKSMTFVHGPAGKRLTAGKPESDDTKPGPPNATQYAENMVSIALDVDNTADFSAIGAWKPGADGHQGKLTVGLRNSGPGHLYDRSGGEAAPNVLVVFPKGVTVAKEPAGCSAVRWENGQEVKNPVKWACDAPSDVPAGFQKTYDFDLKVTAADPVAVVSLQNTRSSVEPGHPSAVMPWDHNPGNDLTRVTLGTKADGSVPTPGASPSASASPSTPTGSASPSTHASPSASASASQSAGAGAGAGSASSGGGALAFTGASGLGTIAAAGTGAVLIGGAVFLATRRRKGAHQ
ncbi:hypothetical protein [Kitasatospora arboriphila]|uniref:LPXTG cell wall anchor domain-containing protein n=1 Tax=Kitasatospora arboriphila TaxID=258052 RepID=A0ABN1TN57_9ACTN